MATGIITKQTDLHVLDATLGLFVPSNWYLGLYQNDLTPDRDTVFADVEEPTDPAYVFAEIFPTDWTLVEETAGWYAKLEARTFLFDLGATIHGWYLSTFSVEVGNILLGIARFDEPIILPSTGGAIPLTITQWRVTGD